MSSGYINATVLFSPVVKKKKFSSKIGNVFDYASIHVLSSHLKEKEEQQ